MGLASLLEGEDGHERSERNHGGVFENLFQADRLWGAEASTINLHVQQIGSRDHCQETQQEQSDDGRPDPQSPANQKQ